MSINHKGNSPEDHEIKRIETAGQSHDHAIQDLQFFNSNNVGHVNPSNYIACYDLFIVWLKDIELPLNFRKMCHFSI